MIRIVFLMTLCIALSSIPKSPEDFVWQNRIMIIKSDLPIKEWSFENLGQKLGDRKLLVFHFSDQKLISSNYPDQIDSAQFLEKLVLKSDKNIQWVLLGLDGGIKKSGKEIPKPEEIFRVIDAMPMRQSEIRNSLK